MLEHNKKMQDFLAGAGITAKVKYINKGSLKRTWRISGKNEDLTAGLWYNTPYLWGKLNELGFTNFDGKPLNKYSGNGGTFSIFARFNA